MPLNAAEFHRRSESLFVSSYLNSVGIIQNVALGVLGSKLFLSPPITSEKFLQAIGAFLAIVIIANEYSW